MNFGFYLPSHGPTARRDPLIEIAQAGERLEPEEMASLACYLASEVAIR